MSCDGTGRAGVTNHLGELFTGKGSEVYKGLVCCDGSIIPTALGVNPLATITALSERSVQLLAKNSGLSIDLDTKNGVLDSHSSPKVSRKLRKHCGTDKTEATSIGWQFTESLSGKFYLGPSKESIGLSDRFRNGSSCDMQMLLTIDICNPREGEKVILTFVSLDL
jgi:hypothetical protein